MSEHHKLKVFLCHASQDKPVVRELYRRFATEGWIDPWLDEEKLLPGQDWDMEIEKVVEATDVVVVCLSNNSVTKEGYVQKEMRFVLEIAMEKPEGLIFVIPIRFDNCEIPRKIRIWQYVDYFPKSTRDRSYQRILNALENRYGSVINNQDSDNIAYMKKSKKRKIARIGKTNVYEIESVLKPKQTGS